MFLIGIYEVVIINIPVNVQVFDADGNRVHFKAKMFFFYNSRVNSVNNIVSDIFLKNSSSQVSPR
jgi:hypothetical protein